MSDAKVFWRGFRIGFVSGFRSGMQPLLNVTARFMLACHLMGFPMRREDVVVWARIIERGWR